MAAPVSPMGSMRPVPGGGQGASDAPQPGLGSLSESQMPPTGPTESDQQDQLYKLTKAIQDQTQMVLSADPSFGPFGQKINQIVMSYLTQLSAKKGQQGGQGEQPRY